MYTHILNALNADVHEAKTQSMKTVHAHMGMGYGSVPFFITTL